MVTFLQQVVKVRDVSCNHISARQVRNKFLDEIVSDHEEMIGLDSALPIVLKCCANELSKTLCGHFNAPLRECVVPAVWKMSSIMHVPEKQNISNMNELRQVALTTCVMKEFERCVLFRLNRKVFHY